LRLQVLTAANIKIMAFWDIAPCSLVLLGRRFRDAYCLHQQSFTALMMKAVSNSETSVYYGAMSQKALIFTS